MKKLVYFLLCCLTTTQAAVPFWKALFTTEQPIYLNTTTESELKHHIVNPHPTQKSHIIPINLLNVINIIKSGSQYLATNTKTPEPIRKEDTLGQGKIPNMFENLNSEYTSRKSNELPVRPASDNRSTDNRVWPDNFVSKFLTKTPKTFADINYENIITSTPIMKEDSLIQGETVNIFDNQNSDFTSRKSNELPVKPASDNQSTDNRVWPDNFVSNFLTKTPTTFADINYENIITSAPIMKEDSLIQGETVNIFDNQNSDFTSRKSNELPVEAASDNRSTDNRVWPDNFVSNFLTKKPTTFADINYENIITSAPIMKEDSLIQGETVNIFDNQNSDVTSRKSNELPVEPASDNRSTDNRVWSDYFLSNSQTKEPTTFTDMKYENTMTSAPIRKEDQLRQEETVNIFENQNLEFTSQKSNELPVEAASDNNLGTDNRVWPDNFASNFLTKKPTTFTEMKNENTMTSASIMKDDPFRQGETVNMFENRNSEFTSRKSNELAAEPASDNESTDNRVWPDDFVSNLQTKEPMTFTEMKSEFSTESSILIQENSQDEDLQFIPIMSPHSNYDKLVQQSIVFPENSNPESVENVEELKDVYISTESPTQNKFSLREKQDSEPTFTASLSTGDFRGDITESDSRDERIWPKSFVNNYSEVGFKSTIPGVIPSVTHENTVETEKEISQGPLYSKSAWPNQDSRTETYTAQTTKIDEEILTSDKMAGLETFSSQAAEPREVITSSVLFDEASTPIAPSLVGTGTTAETRRYPVWPDDFVTEVMTKDTKVSAINSITDTTQTMVIATTPLIIEKKDDSRVWPDDIESKKQRDTLQSISNIAIPVNVEKMHGSTVLDLWMPDDKPKFERPLEISSKPMNADHIALTTPTAVYTNKITTGRFSSPATTPTYSKQSLMQNTTRWLPNYLRPLSPATTTIKPSIRPDIYTRPVPLTQKPIMPTFRPVSSTSKQTTAKPVIIQTRPIRPVYPERPALTSVKPAISSPRPVLSTPRPTFTPGKSFSSPQTEVAPVPANAVSTIVNNVNVSDSICKKSSGRHILEDQCDAYIECKEFKARKYLCPDGLRFNPNAPEEAYPCYYPKDVSCIGRPVLQKAKATKNCPHSFGFFRISDPSDCGRFRVCNDGIAHDFKCPEGLAYNAKTYRCEWADGVTGCNVARYIGFQCPTEQDNIYESPRNSYFRYPTDCTKYYACISGMPRVLRCDNGYAFDELLGRCGPIEQVEECKIGKIQHEVSNDFNAV